MRPHTLSRLIFEFTLKRRAADQSPSQDGGKSGLHRAEVSPVMGGGRGESPRDGKRNREQTAPKGVMVKRRGKSPPTHIKQCVHGKPTSEQDQIGIRRAARPARLRKGFLRIRVDCSDE